MRDKVFELQIRDVLQRFPTERAKRLAGNDIRKPTGGRGGSITGNVAVTPAAPAGLFFDGELLALDRHGFVATSSFWTGSSGSGYELYDIPPGEYYVFFLSEGWTYDAHTGTVINEFYNNTTQWPQATRVTVTEGGTASGINFDLQSNSGYVTVTVRSSTGQPMANTMVDFELFPYLPSEENELLDLGRTLYFGLQTDASGQVTVGPIPLGTFYMSCRAENSSLIYYPNASDPADAQPLSLTTVNQTITGVQFDLAPGGNITGMVTLEDGTPGMFVMIEVYPFGAQDWVASEFTMFDGTYTVNGLPPGQYAVRADPGFIYPDLAAEYWNDKPSAETADPVVVVPGQTTTGINFVLSPGGTINGTISSDTPAAFEGTFFFISAFEPDDSVNAVAYTFADGLGDYTLGGLREGTYKVSLQGFPYPVLPLYYDGEHSFQDADLVSVGTGSTDNIDFSLPSRGTISGRVTAPGAPDIMAVVEFVIAYPEDLPTEGDALWYLFPAPIMDDGTYSIPGLPTGRYKVWVSTQFAGYGEYGYCPEYYNGFFNFDEATAIQVTEGQTTSNIDITLDREAIVQGFISLPNGSPASDADVEVIVLAYDAQSGYPVGVGISDEAPVYIDDNNTFCAGYRIRRLPARTVKIAAVPYGAQVAGGYYGGGHTFDQGGSITLTAGQTYGSDANLALEPGTAKISGTVTREDDASPLNWVVVASYDLTGHLTGFSPSGIDPATGDPWQNGRYEIESLFNGSTHYVRTWSLFAWLQYELLNPDVNIVPADEWWQELPADMLPLEIGFLMPFGYYYFFGFMPHVNVPFDATQVSAPASNINFTLGYQGQGADISPNVPGHLILSANPNPSEGLLNLELLLNAPGSLRAELFDLSGRWRGTAEMGSLQAGLHLVSLDLKELGASASGVYTLRVCGVGTAASQRVVLLR